MPYVFTEQGVAMLSSVLNSERAIMVNIQIIRAFVNLRRMTLTNVELKRKVERLERKHNIQFRAVFAAIKELLRSSLEQKNKRIGFHA